jgi:type II secretion system protein I
MKIAFPSRKLPGSSQGFTLIEVLIALTISGLLIGFAVSQVGQIATERIELQERLAAETVAWNKLMDQYQLVEGWVERSSAAESSGEEEAIGRDWLWSLQAESTLAEDFYRYEVAVFPQDDTESNTALLAAYFIVE